MTEVPDEIIDLLANSQEFLGQVLIDFVLMSLLTLISDRRNQMRMATEKTSTLRQTFQGWLLVVIVMGYLVIASLTYTFLSIVARGTAELDMQTEIEYIENQLTERENIISSVRKRTGMSAEAAEGIHATTIAGVTSKLSLGDGAVAAVADNDVIVSSNVRDWLGKRFRGVVGGGLNGGFTDSLYQNTRSMGGLDLARYRSSTLRLEPGDELLLYTDGATEACDPNDVLYGEEQLERYLNQHLMDHPRQVIQGVRTSLARWADGAEQSDDITMLALEYGAAPEVTDSITVAAETENLERARAFLHAELGQRLCPISTQNQIDVAFEELFVNVCYYAYSQMGGKGDVCISYTYRTNPSTFTVEIKDWGVPFDPTAKANPTLKTDYMSAKPGGLGIFMAKKSVDDMSYVRDGEANVVAFTKTW